VGVELHGSPLPLNPYTAGLGAAAPPGLADLTAAVMLALSATDADGDVAGAAAESLAADAGAVVRASPDGAAAAAEAAGSKDGSQPPPTAGSEVATRG
jgi:hypothetical protein